MTKLVKSYDADLELNEGQREVLAIISTDSIDRDGEVVSPKGLKKKNFSGNPVVMVNHDYNELPVGKALWVKADSSGKKVLAKYRVAATPRGDEILSLLQQGILNAHSIGFVSNHASKPTTAEKNANPNLEKAKLIHRDWEMMEFSVVGIPCNPDAVALAVSKGFSGETMKFLTAGVPSMEEKLPEVEGIGSAIIETKSERLSEQQIRKAYFETLYRRLSR